MGLRVRPCAWYQLGKRWEIAHGQERIREWWDIRAMHIRKSLGFHILNDLVEGRRELRNASVLETISRLIRQGSTKGTDLAEEALVDTKPHSVDRRLPSAVQW